MEFIDAKALLVGAKLRFKDNAEMQEALNMAIILLEKQIPKNPIIESWEPARCPSCDEALSESMGDGYYRHNYNLNMCECGQKLKWE